MFFFIQQAFSGFYILDPFEIMTIFLAANLSQGRQMCKHIIKIQMNSFCKL